MIASTVRAIMWGHRVHGTVRKFPQSHILTIIPTHHHDCIRCLLCQVFHFSLLFNYSRSASPDGYFCCSHPLGAWSQLHFNLPWCFHFNVTSPLKHAFIKLRIWLSCVGDELKYRSLICCTRLPLFACNNK